MKVYTGIDLGSTTTKAVILDEGGEVLGRGITNSRSYYDLVFPLYQEIYGRAAEDIVNPFGQVMEKAGATRDGGSFYERMGRVACWNAVMDENQYMVRKWNEFIAA